MVRARAGALAGLQLPSLAIARGTMGHQNWLRKTWKTTVQISFGCLNVVILEGKVMT